MQPQPGYAAPGYAAPVPPQPGYAAPVPPQPRYAAPIPPQPGYAAPVPPQPQPGFAPPYAAPAVGGYAPPRTAPGSRTLGAVAFILSLAAALVAPIVASVAGLRIGSGIGYEQLMALSTGSDSEGLLLSALTPVRGDVLVAEIAFWSGSVLGIWAIVQGIVAIATRRGRGFGVAAIVIAAIGPVVFFTLLALFIGLGAAGSVPPNA
jgi:hypothetical protein